jgi:hypothetical protein
MTSKKVTTWIGEVEKRIAGFSAKYSHTYRYTDRQIAAAFEIGCFHALVDFYSADCNAEPKNLVDGAYRYLTSPNGNPKNFSYVFFQGRKRSFELRQQVRIRSHKNPDISFTPDIVVLPQNAYIERVVDPDYAGGVRGYYAVSSDAVIAAHECKSMAPFPELLVSFIGMFMVGHGWADQPLKDCINDAGLHLAPTLFVGGTPRGLHARMTSALSALYPINIVMGFHKRTVWRLARKDLCLLNNPILNEVYAKAAAQTRKKAAAQP